MTFPDLLESSYRTTAGALAATTSLDAPSPCEGWTARDVTNHLVGGLDLFGRVVAGEDIPPEEYADTGRDYLGSDATAAFESAAQQAFAGFSRPGALEQVYPFAFGPTPGIVIANISLSESLVHGWDIAHSAGLPYEPDDAMVAAVQEFQSQGTEEQRTSNGMFAAAKSAPADAEPITRLVMFLGRQP